MKTCHFQSKFGVTLSPPVFGKFLFGIVLVLIDIEPSSEEEESEIDMILESDGVSENFSDLEDQPETNMKIWKSYVQ